MNQRFLKLERKVELLERALADRLECPEGIDFKRCQFPEFAQKVIDILCDPDSPMAEELRELIK